MTLNTLTIRADAGPHVGLGHVMRCLAVAEAARDAGTEVTMVSPTLPENVNARLTQSGIAWHPADGGVPKSDALLVDGYGFTLTDARRWREDARVMAVMDDNAEMTDWPADLVINPNPHAKPALYHGWCGPRFLFGSAYAPLRREFTQATPITPRQEANRILVTMGGSDPQRLSPIILEGLEAVGMPLEIHAVLGQLAEAPALDSHSRHHLTIDRDVKDMSLLMTSTDVAISAAGSTLWELAALGVPTVAVIVAKNQWLAASAAAEKGMLRLVEPQEAAQEAAALLSDFTARQSLSAAAHRQVDGHGAQRILEALRAACR